MAIPTHIVINSAHLANAIRTIVKYYPSESLTDNVLIFSEPYPLLYHHFSDLENYATLHPQHDDMEVRVEHINLLVGFLRKSVLPEWNAEKALHNEPVPKCTFSNLWMIFKPGDDVITNETNSSPRGMVIGTVDINRTYYERVRFLGLFFYSVHMLTRNS